MVAYPPAAAKVAALGVIGLLPRRPGLLRSAAFLPRLSTASQQRAEILSANPCAKRSPRSNAVRRHIADIPAFLVDPRKHDGHPQFLAERVAVFRGLRIGSGAANHASAF
jgi:hypothetical protein